MLRLLEALASLARLPVSAYTAEMIWPFLCVCVVLSSIQFQQTARAQEQVTPHFPHCCHLVFFFFALEAIFSYPLILSVLTILFFFLSCNASIEDIFFIVLRFLFRASLFLVLSAKQYIQCLVH